MFKQDSLPWKMILLFFTHKYWPVLRPQWSPARKWFGSHFLFHHETSASQLLLLVLTDPISMKSRQKYTAPIFQYVWSVNGIWISLIPVGVSKLVILFFPHVMCIEASENLLMVSRWNAELGRCRIAHLMTLHLTTWWPDVDSSFTVRRVWCSVLHRGDLSLPWRLR